MDKTFLQKSAKRMKWSLVLGLLFAFFTINPGTLAQKTRRQSPSAQDVIEIGKFKFYETKLVQGEENYTIKQTPAGALEVNARIDLPSMEHKASVAASLLTDNALTPIRFSAEGTRPLGVPIDTLIVINNNAATITSTNRENPGTARQLSVPKNFFAFGGYAPVTMEMLLMRYWLAHDSLEAARQSGGSPL